MATVADLIAETQRRIAGRTRLEFNELASGLNASATTVTFKHNLGGVTPGSYIAVGEEVMYVWSVDSTAKSAVVRRGALGSAAATHSADDLVETNARYARPHVRQVLQEEIASWPRTLFQVDGVNVEVMGHYPNGFPLPISENWFFVLDVRQMGRDNHPRVRWFSVHRDAPSQPMLLVNEPVASGTLRVTYGKPFSLSSFDDGTDIEAIGLESSMRDIPPLGAAWRLLSMDEGGRSDAQARGPSRPHDEVPPGHIMSVAQSLKALRDQRIGEEAQRLMSQWPTRHA